MGHRGQKARCSIVVAEEINSHRFPRFLSAKPSVQDAYKNSISCPHAHVLCKVKN